MILLESQSFMIDLDSLEKKYLDFISMLFILFFSSFVVYYGWLIAYDSLKVGRTSSTILDVPSFLTELAIPLCFFLLVIRVSIEIVRKLGLLSKIMTIALIIFSLFLMLFLSVPIAFGLGSIGLILMLLGDISPLMVPQTFYSVGDNFILLAVPMFLMMSNILLKAGIGDDLFGFAQAWVGNFPGGLAIATILSCSIFAAISGSSVATAATISTVAYPAMIKRGYHKNFCLGILAAGGTLGILIPPSIPMIVYAFVVEESVIEYVFSGNWSRNIAGISLYNIFSFVCNFLQ